MTYNCSDTGCSSYTMQLFNSQFAIGRSCIIKICFRRHELLSTQKCSYTSFCILNRRRQLFTAQSSNTIKGIKLRHLDKINLHRNCSRSSFPFAPTIFSLSSGHGKCGVAVVRVSGPAVSLALQEIAQFRTMPTPRKATLRRLVDPVTGVEIDRALVLYFPGRFLRPPELFQIVILDILSCCTVTVIIKRSTPFSWSFNKRKSVDGFFHKKDHQVIVPFIESH